MSKTQEFEFNIPTPDLSIPNHVVIFQWMPKPACCFFLKYAYLIFPLQVTQTMKESRNLLPSLWLVKFPGF